MTVPMLSDRLKSANRLDKKTVLSLINKAVGYYENCWNLQGEDYGLFGELDPLQYNMKSTQYSSPVIEYVVRPHVQVIVAITAILLGSKKGDIESSENEKLVKYVNQGIKWACKTHLTGDCDVEQFLMRKRWGENWNSSLWASCLSIAAFFGREYIQKEIYEDVKKVVAFEADRFVETSPPNGRRGDSKADETARDTMILAWALCIFPEHPNAVKWHETFLCYALNIASTIYDHANFSELNGKAINSFISTVTLHPDYTLESHGFFHPEFLSYTQWVMVSVLAFMAAGKSVPEVLVRPAHDASADIFLNCLLNNGYSWPIGGQDWPLWMLRPYSFAYSMWRENRIALKTLLNLLSQLAEFQEMIGDGRLIPGMPCTKGGWGLNFESQIGFELAMLYFTPFPDDLVVPNLGRFEKARDINENYSYVQVLIRRNSKTFRSFTWNNLLGRPTGSVVPQSNPLLAGIATDSLVGRLKITGHKVKPEVRFHAEQVFHDGFETSGRIVYGSGEGENFLSRDMRVFTWGDDGLLIFDRLIALRDVELESEEACPLYLINDDITGNRINIISGSLEESIVGPSEVPQTFVMPNPWVVVADIMLYQLFWGMEKGIVYHAETERQQPPYWKNIRMNRIYIKTKTGEYRTGQTIRQLGIYVGLGKSARWFKVNGAAGNFFKGLVLIEGKNTLAL